MRPRFKHAPAPPAQSNAPLHRWIATCIFFALQVCKLFSGGTGAFYNYTALDFLFCLLLSQLRIPWLDFRSRILAGIFLMLVVINAILFDQYLIKVPVLFLINLTGRQISVTGHRVKPESSKSLARQYLSGKYTVNLLPEAIATLQVDDPVCVDNGDAAYFHLILNNTAPQSVSLAARGYDGEFFNIDFDQKQLRNVLTKSMGTITHMYLPVSHPGYYRLGEVVDKSLANVRVKSSLISVPSCPSIKVNSPKQKVVCQNTPYSPDFEITGIPPFEVVLANKTILKVGKDDNKQLSTVRFPAQIDTSRKGESKLEVIAIKDALNNWVNISAGVNVEVHSPAVIQRLKGIEDVPLLDGAKATFSIESSDYPLVFVYSSPDGEQHTAQITSDKFSFPLDQEGSYIIEKLSGSVCSVGKIVSPSQIRVFKPPSTSLKATFEQLKDKCSGPSGINADLVLEGTPPFKVWYRTIAGSRVLRQDSIDSQEKENIITFKPGSIGTFKYQVTAVQDKYRKVELSGPEYEQTQTIRELAGASFSSGMKTSYCPDQVAHVTAKVQGKGPLKLVYELDGKHFTEENVDGDLTISLGKLSGGKHRVVLRSITDTEGCTTPLDVHSPLIEVRSKLANVEFTGPHNIRVYDTHLDLPLRVANADGKKQRLKYSINGTEVFTTLKDSKLPITQPGVYQLLEFDDGCLGTIGKQDKIIVSVYERPSIEVIETQDHVCSGSDGIADTLQLKGEAPFKVWSEVVDPKGKVTYDVQETVNTKIRISHKSRGIPGTWTTYYWLADQLYPKGEKSSSALVLKQQVREEPVIMHARAGSVYSLCQNVNEPQGIPVVLKGVGAFIVTLELKDEKNKLITRKVEIERDGRYNLHEPLEGLQGSFQVKLKSVKDAFGCEGYPVATQSTVQIKTVKAPKLALDRLDYCVGDHVELDKVQGNGILKLGYTLNKRKYTVSTDDSFSLLASTPGALHLSTLEDESMCPTKLDKTINIHDLPSSRITRQPSFNIHRDEDIELRFAFTGTAPFTFVYTRSVDGREIERHTVSEVLEKEHSIFVHENGVYEVVSLKDAYCSVSL